MFGRARRRVDDISRSGRCLNDLRIAGRVLSTLIVLGAFAPAIAADRTATEILKELNDMKRPQFVPKAGEDRQKAIEAFYAETKVANEKRAALIDELRKADPENEKLVKLLPERWMVLAQTGQTDALLAEIDERRRQDEERGPEGGGPLPQGPARDDEGPRRRPEARRRPLRRSSRPPPKDRRAPPCSTPWPARSATNPRRTPSRTASSRNSPTARIAEMIKGARRQREAVGKPFDLEFTDAVKGTRSR